MLINEDLGDCAAPLTRSMATAGLRDGDCQPDAVDILLETRAIRIRMPHCELKYKIPIRSARWINFGTWIIIKPEKEGRKLKYYGKII